MLKNRAQIVAFALLILDMMFVLVAWEFAYIFRFFLFDFPKAVHIPNHVPYLIGGLTVMFIACLVFTFSGLYHVKAILSHQNSHVKLLQASLFLFLTIPTVPFFYREFSFSRLHAVYFMLFLIISLFGMRQVMRWILKRCHQQGLYLGRSLLIGTSQHSTTFDQTLRQHIGYGLKIEGVVVVSQQEVIEGNIKTLGTLEKLPEILATYQIDRVFMLRSAYEYKHFADIEHLLHEQFVDVCIIPDLQQWATLSFEVEQLGDLTLMTLVQSPVTGWQRVFKRTFDLVGALTAIILFAPVMVLVAIAIKLTSHGPIFYRQERMGLDGQHFGTLKFRSMRVDAEKETGAIWAKSNDDRRTPIGALLRKTSLDELPQLFNVILGEMSLVGPRPERPVFIEQFKTQIPKYMLRHKVKAGITGWAQVNGWRGDTSLEQRIKCDLYYIQHWSLWLDVKILFLTVFTGFTNPNAY